MFESIIWVVLACIALMLILVVVKHFTTVARVRFYEKQGITAMPGYETFFVGNGPLLRQWGTIRN